MRLFLLTAVCAIVYFASMAIPHSVNEIFYVQKTTESLIILLTAKIIAAPNVLKIPIILGKTTITDVIILTEILAIIVNIFTLWEYYTARGVFYTTYSYAMRLLFVSQILAIIWSIDFNAMFRRINKIFTFVRDNFTSNFSDFGVSRRKKRQCTE